MTDDKTTVEKPRQGMLDKFETGSESGPIEDRNEREQRLNQLLPGQRELALENARLGDLCQYLSQEKMDIPADILDRIGRLSKCAPQERIRELASINQALMEFLNQVGSGPQLWQ